MESKRNAKKRKYAVSGVSNLGNYLSIGDGLKFPTSIDSDEYLDEKLVSALQILQRLMEEDIPVAQLTKLEQDYLAYYFYKTNKIISRALKLKVSIPISVFTIRKPKVEDDIVQDFVYNFFKKNLMEDRDIKKILYEAILNMNLYGSGYILVQHDNNLVKDPTEKNAGGNVNPEDFDRKSILEKYNEDPNSVSSEDIIRYIRLTFPNLNVRYKGYDRVSVIDNFDIEGIEVNTDLEIKYLSIKVSEHIKNAYDQFISSTYDEPIDVLVDQLVKFGYTKNFVKLNLDAILEGSKSFVVSSDPSDGVHFVEFSLGDEYQFSNPLLPVMDDAIDMEIMKYKQRSARKSPENKTIYLLSSTDANPEDISDLVDDVVSRLEEDDVVVVGTNFDINTNDMSIENKNRNDEDMSSLKENLATGLGIPMSFINADDTYSGSYISMQMLNTELISFSEFVISQLKSKILTPLSKSKGFVTRNMFGNIQVVTPMIGMFKGSLLVSDNLDLIKDLVSDGVLPYSVLLESYLGFDYEEVTREKAREEKLQETLSGDSDTKNRRF